MGNARATVDTGGHFSYNVFVENLTNDPGYSGGNNDQAVPNYSRARIVIRPRTYGVGIRYKF